MSLFNCKWAGIHSFILLALFVWPGLSLAQDAKLKINQLDKLASKAEQTVDVNLDSSLLQLAAKFLSSAKPDEAKARELVSGLKGIYVRSFEFNEENAYSNDDINGIRSQLLGPEWVKLVGIRSKRDKEDVEVFTSTAGQKIKGLAIICAQPKELTVVNIVGSIDLEKLSELEGQFGIPKLGLEGAERAKKDQKEKGSDSQ